MRSVSVAVCIGDVQALSIAIATGMVRAYMIANRIRTLAVDDCSDDAQTLYIFIAIAQLTP